MQDKDQMKFVIIGCGRIAERHALHIASRGVLKAVCDIVKERADELAARYNATSYYNIDDLLAAENHIDVAAICSPNGFHAEHSIKCLEAGLHVLCEKPMALSVGECGAMIEAAEKANRLLAVVKQNRFNPPVLELRHLIETGRLGRIYSFQMNCFWNRNEQYYLDSAWKGTAEVDGGTLFTQFSHFIDLLYWLLGDLENVYAQTRNFHHKDIIDFEDTGVAVLTFENGVVGALNYTVNSYATNMEGSLTIFAEKGTVKIGGQYLNKLEYYSIENYTVPALSESGAANDYGTYSGSMSNHDKVYDNLIAVLHHGVEVHASGEDGLKTVEIIRKIYDAAKATNDHIKSHAAALPSTT